MTSKRVSKQDVTVTSKTRARTRKTKTEFDVLSPMEEKIVRMRHGVLVESETELSFMDEFPGIPPEAAAQIRAIERRALEMQGQLQPLSTKSKIISSLKQKTPSDD